MPPTLRSSSSRDGSTAPQGRDTDTVVLDEGTRDSQSSNVTRHTQLEDLVRSQAEQIQRQSELSRGHSEQLSGQSEQLSELRQMFAELLSKLTPRGAEGPTQGGSHGERSSGEAGAIEGLNHSDTASVTSDPPKSRKQRVASSSNISTNSSEEGFRTAQTKHKGVASVINQYGPETGDTCHLYRPAIVNQIEPPTFNGDKSKARSWLKRYEDVMNINGFEDHQKFVRARAYLTGEASDWFTMATTINPDTDWYGLKTSFLKYFCGLDSKQFLRRRLDEARQKPTEHPKAYLSRVVGICKEFKPNMTEDELLKKVSQGLNINTYNSLVVLKDEDDWTLEWLADILAKL